MRTAAQILRSKSVSTVYDITPDASSFDAIRLMAEKNIGALLVMKDGALVGVFTERDYARKVALRERSPKETPVRDVMTFPVIYVSPQLSAGECMALITENRVRHLPVLENGRLVGIVSIGDLVKDIISEQEFFIGELQHYIVGEPDVSQSGEVESAATAPLVAASPGNLASPNLTK